MKVTAIVLMGLVMLGHAALGQEAMPAPDQYSPADLAAMEKTLEQKVDASGVATETVKKYASDYTMLAYRNKTGKAELHEKFADFYFVIGGEATLVSGGRIVNSAPIAAPGEVRGDSVQDGKEIKLKKGDVVHIPANIPHQLVLAKGATFQYFIIKVQEIN